MYSSSNLSCSFSNGTTIDNLLGVMETDFLNFHDEEHFGTALYQNDLLDDSQSSLLDIVGDDYSRQDSREYVDHSVIWEQDVERELNGDVAVIPMSGQIDSFPKLSNSPPSKDFQKIFSDWQHLASIETAPTEDLAVDLQLPNQGLVVDMLDCFTPANVAAIPPPAVVEPIAAPGPRIKSEPVDIIPKFDFSKTTIPEIKPKFKSEETLKKKEIKPPVRKTGGKNLELLKKVVKEEIDLETTFKIEVNSSDELDILTDNFDITSYVNGDDDMLLEKPRKVEAKTSSIVKTEKRSYSRKYGGCYEKNMPLEDSDTEELEEDEDEEDEIVKEETKIEERKSLHEDSEEDCIDVETVENEQMPVLQARDLTSLLEQFEASEAVNPKLPQNLFEEKQHQQSEVPKQIEKSTPKPIENKPITIKTEPQDCQPSDSKIPIDNKTTSLVDNQLLGTKKHLVGETKPKIKQTTQELKQSSSKQVNKNIRDSLPLELIQKIKASGAKKSISVIPAMPSKKPRGTRIQDAAAQLNRNKLLKIVKNNACQNQNESIQLDHDYCSMSPVRPTHNSSRRNSSDSDGNMKKFNSPDRSFSVARKETKCDKNVEYLKPQKSKDLESSDMQEDVCKVKKNIVTLIDDTAIRIGKQIKNAINNENALKQKLIFNRSQDSILKNQPTVKNADGKLMVSLLKTNNRISTTNLMNKINGSTIINTVNTNDEQIQNIIVNENSDEIKQNAKKRKLNLEEYKRLRGDIIKPNSCDNSRNNSPGNSGANSPMPVHNEKEKVVEEKYQELMMKMASEILKTNAKSKQTTSDAKLEEFVPPDAPKVEKIEDKIEEKPLNVTKSPTKPINDNYEIKTIVSIGVNTEESFLKSQQREQVEPKIAFKLLKKKEITRNKFFDTKSSESEDQSPKKDVDKSKLTEIITPILQNASAIINRNSLITNITATLLQQSPKISPKADTTVISDGSTAKPTSSNQEEPLEHGEDKTVIILNKNDEKPAMKSVGIQTDSVVVEETVKEKPVRQYRTRRDSSASSSTSVSSIKSKNNTSVVRKSSTRRQSHRNSSSNSVSSSLGSRWSRSRSRSRSRSSSAYSNSSYSSDSSRSKSRSVSPSRRWHMERNSRSRHRYSRSRRRSRSNSYRGNYRRSRSPYSRSRSRLRRERESAERERVREVEERRVIYVGKISDDTTKADLRRRFQNFGPITNVSVHFRDHGDNYGFVTFAYKVDAYEAVERGNDDPNQPKYDISFGGRRAFCKTRYSDLDNIEAESMNPTPIFRRDEDSFDILLREVQAKLRKRKV